MRFPLPIHKHLLSACLFGGCFTVIALFYEHPFLSHSNSLLQAVIYNYSDGAYTHFFTHMTNLGSASVYVISSLILIAGFAIMKHTRGLICFPLSMVGSTLMNILLKNLLLKPRPSVDHLVQAHSYSFPSGHAMNAMVFYGLVSFFFLEFFEKKWSRVVTLFFASFLILVIGLSRVYLGVHYPLDIIGGYLAGLTWLFLFIYCYTKFDRFKNLFGGKTSFRQN